MGKSPARWLKSVLLGKKSSKSGASKGKERALNETKVLVTAKVEEPDTELEQPIVPVTVSSPADRIDYVAEADDAEDAKSSDDEPSDLQRSMPSDALSDAEKIQEEKAAIAVQAAFKGYLARRAFWALKGIIRLQALIRGHLVRRQAVATLCCTMGIVKLQALVRARHVRYSEEGVEVRRKCRLSLTVNKLADPVGTTYLGIRTLTSNAFVLKILAPSPKVMPLQLRYDSADPNSASNWLECWSASRFWKPAPHQWNVSSKKSQKKLGNAQIADAEAGKPKKSVRKVPSASLDNPSGQTPVEFEKPKRAFRKVPSQPVEPVVENPQVELEKIKRNLRKVHNPVVENSIQPQPQTQPETEIEKPKFSVDRTSEPSPPIHGVEQIMSNVDETIKEDTPVEGDMKHEMTTVPGQEMTELSDALPIDQANPVDGAEQAPVEPKPSMENEIKDDSTPATKTKGNSVGKENQKSGKKGSAAAKKEASESNGQQSSPALPSYMQATQSAKAKLRLQGSPKSAGQDEAVEKNNVSRRHSLPTSGNGRITASHTPRTQRGTNSGGKIGNKSDKSLMSSRDSNGKGNQVEWKR